MGDSVYFGGQSPVREHLVRGSGGLAGEINDLRGDIDEAFETMEGGGMVRCDVFVDPPAADPDGIKVSFATQDTARTLRENASDFDGAEGATLTGGPRAIEITRAANVGSYQFADDIVVRGTAYGEKVTLTFTAGDADGGDTLTSNEDRGLDTIDEVDIPADVDASGAYEIGFGDGMALFRGIKDQAGDSDPLKEVEAGTVVTTGVFSERIYTPPVNVPDGSRDFAVVYIADPAI